MTCQHDKQHGRSGANGHSDTCLICETARLFAGWRYPATARYQRAAHGRATEADQRRPAQQRRYRLRAVIARGAEKATCHQTR